MAIVYFMLFMFFVGCIQLVWAFVHPLVSDNRDLRRHFGYYWIGVLLYVVGLLPFYAIDKVAAPYNDYLSGWCAIFFFVGAWTLAVYHVLIVSKQGRFGKSKLVVDPFESDAPIPQN